MFDRYILNFLLLLTNQIPEFGWNYKIWPGQPIKTLSFGKNSKSTCRTCTQKLLGREESSLHVFLKNRNFSVKFLFWEIILGIHFVGDDLVLICIVEVSKDFPSNNGFDWGQQALCSKIESFQLDQTFYLCKDWAW